MNLCFVFVKILGLCLIGISWAWWENWLVLWEYGNLKHGFYAADVCISYASVGSLMSIDLCWYLIILKLVSSWLLSSISCLVVLASCLVFVVGLSGYCPKLCAFVDGFWEILILSLSWVWFIMWTCILMICGLHLIYSPSVIFPCW